MKKFNDVVGWIFGIVFLSWLIYCFMQLEAAVLNTNNLVVLICITIAVIFGFAGVYNNILEIIFPHKCWCCSEKKRGVHDRSTGQVGTRHTYGKHYVLAEIKYALCRECYDEVKYNDNKKVNIDKAKKRKKYLESTKLAAKEDTKKETPFTETNNIENNSQQYSIDGLELIYEEKNLEPKKINEDKYLYVSVKYNDSSWEYSYISNYKEIKVDDLVVVDAMYNNTTAKVSNIAYYSEKNVPYPVSKTKIIKKIYRKK